MTYAVAAVLMLLGTGFALVAAIGILRLPDVFCRMHAATKAGAFGGTLVVAGAAVFFGDVWSVVQAALIVIFFYVTAPIGAQMIGRAAYLRGAPMCDETVRDDLGAHDRFNRPDRTPR
ncbi:MAG: monovalent cation/H(+) antiporter subunit G [Candidatus Krumholzibacteriia bacterium]